MPAIIGINRIIDFCFMAQFFVYGFMALYPYDDYKVAERMENTENKRYLHSCRAFGVIYIFLSIATFFGLHPAPVPTNGGLAAFSRSGMSYSAHVAHTWMLLGLCNWNLSTIKSMYSVCYHYLCYASPM